jgi:hypothetical protein
MRLDSDDDDDESDDDDNGNNDTTDGSTNADGDADDGSASNDNRDGDGGPALRILALLARCQNLRQLRLAPTFTDAAATYIRRQRRVKALFGGLCDAAMRVDGASLPYFSQLLSASPLSLTRLRLTISHGSYAASVFESAARLAQLRSLTEQLELDLRNVVM